MINLFINPSKSVAIPEQNYDDLVGYVIQETNLTPDSFYLEQNGKRLQSNPSHDAPVYLRLRLLGGKGGFGSMLRAIGAQIEKTTNREACRDLSGRRLRDINEEKRLKAWLEKQGEREREAEERKKRKIEKLLAVPKHEFKDEEYEQARSKLTEKVCDAVEEGFKKAADKSDLKRKCEPSTSAKAAPVKAKKPALWIDDDLSGSSDTDSDDSDDDDAGKKNNKTKDKTADTKSIAQDESSSSNDSESLSNKVSPDEETNSSDDSKSAVSAVSK
ncbi:splicing regulator SDE2 [Musca vetustissima]|uniref:splicing regulator SDE2 n=1 Tax=Musca vetustissima TaxID=27455 RepID=UPI002AB628F0|nr:splicing regulator SDE2 [Musca vetustissima]